MNQNFQIILDKTIRDMAGRGEKPKLLLHSCCAPCSSYVLEYLSEFFDITVFYYNPNISPKDEFEKRLLEQKRLVHDMNLDINVESPEYDSSEFFEEVKGLENEPEGGARCEKCFALRLFKTAQYAKQSGFEYFTTTLSISPLKNSQLLNEIGKLASEKFGVKYLFSDFKKKNGYKRSCELSRQYNLYRQNYCGCVFSKKQAEDKNKTDSVYEVHPKSV